MHIQIDRSTISAIGHIKVHYSLVVRKRHYIWVQLADYKQAAQSGTLQGQLVLEEKDWSSGPPEMMVDFLGPLDTKL